MRYLKAEDYYARAEELRVMSEVACSDDRRRILISIARTFDAMGKLIDNKERKPS